MEKFADGGIYVTVDQWSAALQQALNLEIDFTMFRSELIDIREDGEDVRVDYKAFLDRYKMAVSIMG